MKNADDHYAEADRLLERVAENLREANQSSAQTRAESLRQGADRLIALAQAHATLAVADYTSRERQS